MLSRDFLTGVVEDAGLEPDDVRWDYSGRGMYGKTCFGFVGGLRDLAAFFVQLGQAEVQSPDTAEQDAAYCLAQALTSDDMGMSTIFYFPGVEVAEDDVEVDEPDPDHARDVALDAELGVG
jgi:hypothetical protein